MHFLFSIKCYVFCQQNVVHLHFGVDYTLKDVANYFVIGN